jgi:antitoxin YqcF
MDVREVAALAFGGAPQVVPAGGGGEPAFAVLTCADAPAPGLASHSTVTLHEARNMVDGISRPVELAGVAPAAALGFRDALASAAASIVADGWLAAPGVVYADLLDGLSPTLPHVLLVEPFVWPELTRVRVREGVEVHWLLAVAISEPERRLLRRSGDAALLAQLGRRRVPYWDLERPSAV